MKKKNNIFFIIIIIFLVVALIFSPIILYISYNSSVNSKINLTEIPYANQTITQDTKITPDMISYMYVPKKMLMGNYLKSNDEIIGKCTKNNSIIIEGSMYYSDLLTNCDTN